MENIVLKIENENIEVDIELSKDNTRLKSYTPMYLEGNNLFTQSNDNEVTILETNPNLKSRNNRNKSNVLNEFNQGHRTVS
jgi:hypothetical protein